jgi:hypothetical protein
MYAYDMSSNDIIIQIEKKHKRLVGDLVKNLQEVIPTADALKFEAVE